MARIAVRMAGWCLGRIPTLIVWTGLIGLFIYGAAQGWKFGDDKPKDRRQEGEASEPASFSSSIQEQPFDVPIQVVHDPKTCKAEEKPIRFASAQTATLVGITNQKVEPRTVSVEIEAHGQVMQDPLATSKISPLVGGLVLSLEKQLGDPVRAGELLALIESTDVGKAKAGYLTAKAAFESRQAERALLSPESPQGSIVKADAAVREARAALYSARQTMANLGLPLLSAAEEKLPDEAFAKRLALLGLPFFRRIDTMLRCQTEGVPAPANLLPLYSPIDGQVMKRSIGRGETVAALQQVYEVGDPTRIHVFLDVRQEDFPKVALGQQVSFRLEGGAATSPADGAIDWISPALDEKTRSVRVRAKVANANGVFKSGAFGAGVVTVATPRPVLMVPRDAVHWEGCSYIVFVKKRNGDEVVYWPRRLTLGIRDDRDVQVITGLAAGEEIVTVGSHVLKCELMKARIGDAEE